jgi:hypothetical protein
VRRFINPSPPFPDLSCSWRNRSSIPSSAAGFEITNNDVLGYPEILFSELPAFFAKMLVHWCIPAPW